MHNLIPGPVGDCDVAVKIRDVANESPRGLSQSPRELSQLSRGLSQIPSIIDTIDIIRAIGISRISDIIDIIRAIGIICITLSA